MEKINLSQQRTGKLRRYKKIKIYFVMLELPFYLRNPQTKLKISNHSLRIETVRYILPPLPNDQLACFSMRIRLKISYTFCLIMIPIMIYKNVKIWYYISSFSTQSLIHFLMMRNGYLFQPLMIIMPIMYYVVL